MPLPNEQPESAGALNVSTLHNQVSPERAEEPISDSTKKLDPEAGVAQVDALEIESNEDKPQVEKSCIEETFFEDRIFWGIVAVLLLANVGLHRSVFAGRWFGFILASYSAIANDSIQTLGTFIASNTGIAVWWKQWLWISAVFLGTTIYSWATMDGDISYGRLMSKGYDTAPTEFNYLQTACTIVLLILTRLRIPVSTTFMILTSFVTESKALGKTIMKSVLGYGISFGLAAVVYLPFCKYVTEYCDATRGNLSMVWTYVQWVTTGILWSTWLQQDMSNIAVFLPRSLNGWELTFVCIFITLGLGLMLWQGGDKIQQIVEEKSRVKDIPEATLVDLLFAIVLFVFKIASNIPMSTTWCFVGLLAGREISLALRSASDKTVAQAFYMSGKDLSSVILGFLISLAVGAGGNEYVVESINQFVSGGSE